MLICQKMKPKRDIRLSDYSIELKELNLILLCNPINP
jgi:hypothetical protein